MLNRIFNLIIPKICLHCGKNLSAKENILCSECKISLNFREGNFCPNCGFELEENKCKMCEEFGYSFDQAFSVFKYSGAIKTLVHSIKYGEMKKVGELLAFYMSEYWNKFVKIKDIDFVIPVPLHKVKKRMRGYNQAEIIAKKFAEIQNFEYNSSLIKRKNFTKTQTKLTKIEREKNIKNAFRIGKNRIIENKRILIIDDVFTTGSTVNEISSVLRNFKVNKIFVLTAARA